MSEKLVKVEQEGPVLIVRLASPETRNSLTMELRRELGNAIQQADEDPTVRSVYLTGEGPTFCAGGDLRMLQTAIDPWPVHKRFRDFSNWLTPLITLCKPVVVGVRGHAVGGGMGLALAGDVIIAGESAKLMSGFFRLGTVPDIGMMYHLPRLIGMAKAKKFLFNNATMLPDEALALGLVAQVVADDAVDAAGMAEALRLAQGPAEVMGLAKTMLAKSFETSLHDMLALEGFGQVLAMSNPEFREGIDALVNKRSADFVSVAAAAPHNQVQSSSSARK